MSAKSTILPRATLVLLAAFALAAGLALLLLPASVVGTAEAATLKDAGFADSRVASQASPTALAFTPDGRMLVTSQQGTLNVYGQDGTLKKAGALSLGSSVCTNSERGLLGVAVDSEFATNRYVYVYYTFNKFGNASNACAQNFDSTPANTPVNRVSRFVMDGDTVVRSSEKVIVDGMPSPAGNHNAGDLRFGKDGYLYVTVGDGGCDYAAGSAFSGCAGSNDASRDTNVLLGKVLRVTRDGGIPSDNPYASSGSVCGEQGGDGRTAFGQCKETFASGLRNPFRFAVDPDASGTRLFVNDVGQGKWEEIDEGKAGADYGWNLREGFCANNQTTGCRTVPGATVEGLTDPVHSYGREIGASITGAAFVPNGVWPASYDTSYLFGDSVKGKIFRLVPNGSGGYARTEFATDLGPVISLSFGPHCGSQALYYTTYANGGEVHRISRCPGAAVTASPAFGDDPLDVTLDASGSRDPSGAALTYLWDFGDGAMAETTSPTTTHRFEGTTNREVRLRVRNGLGYTSEAATVTVRPGTTPPAPRIAAPVEGKLFRVGERITLTGSATDPEDGTLSNTSLKWEVRRHHNDDHWHPLYSGIGNNLTFPAPPPEDLSATGPGNYLEVRLTATDSRGLASTVTRRVEPRRVGVTLATSPSGLRLSANGTALTAPRTLTSWEGYGLRVGAAGQKDRYGRTLRFYRWSDGGAASHTVTTPSSATTRTASFRYVPTLTLSARDATLREGDRARLRGKLRTETGALSSKKTVTVWRSVDGGRNWRNLGKAGYNRSDKTYNFTTFQLRRDSLFQLRFAGDAAYTADRSGTVRVQVRR